MTTNDCGAKDCFEREVAWNAALTTPYTVAAWQPICHALWAHGYSKTEALGDRRLWPGAQLGRQAARWWPVPGAWLDDEAGSPMTVLGRGHDQREQR